MHGKLRHTITSPVETSFIISSHTREPCIRHHYFPSRLPVVSRHSKSVTQDQQPTPRGIYLAVSDFSPSFLFRIFIVLQSTSHTSPSRRHGYFWASSRCGCSYSHFIWPSSRRPDMDGMQPSNVQYVAAYPYRLCFCFCFNHYLHPASMPS